MNIERPTSKQPIPPHAKKVFDGIIFEIYQWEQKLFDGSTAVFEKGRRKDDTITTIPITEDGKILLIEDEQPGRPSITVLPAGRLEPGEPPDVGARRELLEETGYMTDDIELLWSHQPVMKLDWAVYFFLARNCRKVSEPQNDPGEKITLKPVSFDELIELAKSGIDFHGIGVALYLLRALATPGKIDEVRREWLGTSF